MKESRMILPCALHVALVLLLTLAACASEPAATDPALPPALDANGAPGPQVPTPVPFDVASEGERAPDSPILERDDVDDAQALSVIGVDGELPPPGGFRIAIQGDVRAGFDQQNERARAEFSASEEASTLRLMLANEAGQPAYEVRLALPALLGLETYTVDTDYETAIAQGAIGATFVDYTAAGGEKAYGIDPGGTVILAAVAEDAISGYFTLSLRSTDGDAVSIEGMFNVIGGGED